MISNRLLQIAMLVERNKVVFDVGSDHALLPCFLLQKGISEKVYAGEIAEGPLNKVKEAVEKAEEAKEAAEDTAEEVGEKAEDVAEEAAEKAEDVAEEVKDAVEDN